MNRKYTVLFAVSMLFLSFASVPRVKAITRITITNVTEDGHLNRSDANIANCPTAPTLKSSSGTGHFFGGRVHLGTYFAYRSYVEWDISEIPIGSKILYVQFNFGISTDLATDEEINPITNQPSTASNSTLWTDIGDGTAYIDPWDVTVTSTGFSSDLISDLQTAIDSAQTWFAIGLQSPDDECPASGTLWNNIDSEDGTTTPELYVEYQAPWESDEGGFGDPRSRGRPTLSIDKFFEDLTSTENTSSSIYTKLFLLAPFAVAVLRYATLPRKGTVRRRRENIEKQKRRSVKRQEKRREDLERKY